MLPEASSIIKSMKDFMMTVPTGTMQKGVKKRDDMADQMHICLFAFNSFLPYIEDLIHILSPAAVNTSDAVTYLLFLRG